jgi:hypothetical protein
VVHIRESGLKDCLLLRSESSRSLLLRCSLLRNSGSRWAFEALVRFDLYAHSVSVLIPSAHIRLYDKALTDVVLHFRESMLCIYGRLESVRIKFTNEFLEGTFMKDVREGDLEFLEVGTGLLVWENLLGGIVRSSEEEIKCFKLDLMGIVDVILNLFAFSLHPWINATIEFTKDSD